MNKDRFQERLTSLGLSKRQFSEISHISYATVTKWGVLRDGIPMSIPHWVEPFLEYYEKAQKFEMIRRDICQKMP